MFLGYLNNASFWPLNTINIIEMAQQVIAPVIPNAGPLSEAIAGSQAVTFTATDRKIIEEKGGTIDRARSFKEVFFKKDVTHKVENEESTVRHEQDLRSLEGRRREHHQMLKNSPMTAPREHVEISNGTAEEVIIPPAVIRKPAETPVKVDLEKVEVPAKTEMRKETAALIKELNLDPAELYDKFALEQQDLHNLVYRIKELHLKRLLSTTRGEFEELTEEIKKETLAAGRPEANEWLESQLDALTRGAAEYKLKLIKSLQSMHFDDEKDNKARWLQKIIDRLSKATS